MASPTQMCKGEELWPGSDVCVVEGGGGSSHRCGSALTWLHRSWELQQGGGDSINGCCASSTKIF